MDTPTHPARFSSSTPFRRSWWGRLLRGLAILTFALFCTAVGTAYFLMHKFSGGANFNFVKTTQDLIRFPQIVFNPHQSFPGRDRVNILCMGLDRNWTRDNMPFTSNARTDTMMLASLDLHRRIVSVISIPRDTRVRMPGTGVYARINEAHSRGGVRYAVDAVEEFLGVKIDYYVIIKQEAIEKAIDAIGGLDIKVEDQMDYDDNWGHLHVHLKPGYQRLRGEQVVGYMRFRHDAEGDFGRIRRQQQVIQTLARRLKDPHTVLQLSGLLDVLNEYVKSDLLRPQLLALASLFHHVQPQDMLTATVPAYGRMIGGVAYVEPIESRTKLLVDWLVRGDEEAGNRLVSVEVVDGCGSYEVARRVVNWLEDQGFEVTYAGRAPRGKVYAISVVVERGTVPRAGRRLLSALGVGGQIEREPATSGSARCTLIIGRDVRSHARFAGSAEVISARAAP
ncbi:MAG: LCP family protein [Armatimonadetes bacterium]|nr:LCP family protein [Armatimonadota bacterium]